MYNICLKVEQKVDKPKAKNQKYVKCGTCYKRINRKHIKSHQRRHTGVRPHACDICTKAFFEKSELKGHMKRGHKILPPAKPEERSNSCDVCGQEFQAKQPVKLRTDTDERMCIRCFKVKWFTAVQPIKME